MLGIIMVILFAAAIPISIIYIYLYYKKERKRKDKEQEYKLYNITFTKDGDTYTQVIGAKTEEGVLKIFYHNISPGDNVSILNIESVERCENNEF